MAKNSIIKLSNVSKSYYNKGIIASGFSKVNLELNMGEFVVITGESGSGKSTLLNVISGLDSYDDGEMFINGEETSHYSELDYENYRRKYIGNIFQNFNLVNSYTVYQNIELVLLLNGYKKKDIKKKVIDVINTVGLSKYKRTKVSKLSGGQKQRVAIARALVKDTPIIVADEPTGNLDVKSAKAIMKLLHEISHDKLVVIVTHNYEQVEEYATRRIVMHDGRITLDKKLTDTSKIEGESADYKNIRFLNKIFLGIRNAFNIKVKFLLLLIVYLVMSLFVFSGYSSLKKSEFDNSNIGFHPLFGDSSTNRVIINKKDKSSFTDEDITKLEKIDNIKSVVKDDLLLDSYYNLNNNNDYYYGKLKGVSEIKKVDKGAMPTSSDEVVLYIHDWQYNEDVIGSTLTLNDDYGNLGDLKLKVSGVIIANDNNMIDIDSAFYVDDSIIDKVRKSSNLGYSKLYLTMNNNIYEYMNDERLYYSIRVSDKVNSGDAVVGENWNYYCEKWYCINKNINLKVSNIYYEDSVDLKIKNVFTNKTFTNLTGLKKDEYDYNTNTIFISSSDYNKLYDKPSYQASVFLSDVRNSEAVLKKLDKEGYNTYYMKDMMSISSGTLNKVVKVIRNIMFTVALIVLFFVAYFIIKLILKSRNIYYSTIRTLGATKGICTGLLNIELLVDINVAYFIFIILINLVTHGVIHSNYLSDMVTYFTLKDYIIIYIMLMFMSFIISNRYAYKLFSSSVMSSYREEI